MDGLKAVPGRDALSTEPGLERHSAPREFSTAPRITRALSMLLDGLEYAEDLRKHLWDFSVELASMRELHVSNVDLRWLIGRGYLAYAVETTQLGDAGRSFRRASHPTFNKRACFVLTPTGAQLARKLCRTSDRSLSNDRDVEELLLSIHPIADTLTPKWDRDRQELRVGTILVKRFKVPANNQEAVLTAFEEEAWPPRIDDPLPPHPDQCPKRRLQETVKSLNRSHKNPLIRFLGDGTGQGVRWEFCRDEFLSRSE